MLSGVRSELGLYHPNSTCPEEHPSHNHFSSDFKMVSTKSLRWVLTASCDHNHKPTWLELELQPDILARWMHVDAPYSNSNR